MFTDRLGDSGFSQADIATIYTIEMELREYFDFDGIMPDCLRLQNIERDGKRIDYYWNQRRAKRSAVAASG